MCAAICHTQRALHLLLCLTDVAELFLAFSDADRVQSATRRLVNFAEITQSIWLGRSDYERRAKKVRVCLHPVSCFYYLLPSSWVEWPQQLMDSIRATLASWTGQPLSSTYSLALEERNSFFKVHRASKREWTKERSQLETVLGNVVTKLKTYSMAPYEPPHGLRPIVRIIKAGYPAFQTLSDSFLQDIDALWTELLAAEAERSKAINANIRTCVAFIGNTS